MKKCSSCKLPVDEWPIKPYSSLTKTCSVSCALDDIEKKKDKDFKQETRGMKKSFNLKDINWQHKQCRRAFNMLRKLQELKWFSDRGLQPVCISCGGELGGDEWACGHFKTVGAQSALRYDPVNTYLQHNVRCNKNLSGDINGTATTHGYKQGLVNRFGHEVASSIIEYCDRNTAPVKWDAEIMESWRKEWNKQIRSIENSAK